MMLLHNKDAKNFITYMNRPRTSTEKTSYKEADEFFAQNRQYIKIYIFYTVICIFLYITFMLYTILPIFG